MYSQENHLGLEDELQISLHNIAPPATGKDYYAWLLSDTDVQPAQFLLLRKLTVSSGRVDIVYPYDAQHTSLLAHYSRFLITVEDASNGAVAPSSNPADWRYYAEIPQAVANDGNSLTVLEQLRALLSGNAADPSALAIGGLAPRFLQSTRGAGIGQ
jgi:hypothetical protein